VDWGWGRGWRIIVTDRIPYLVVELISEVLEWGVEGLEWGVEGRYIVANCVPYLTLKYDL